MKPITLQRIWSLQTIEKQSAHAQAQKTINKEYFLIIKYSILTNSESGIFVGRWIVFVAVVMYLRFIWMARIEFDTLLCCWIIPAEIIARNFWVAGGRTGARVLEEHSHRADQAVFLT